MTLGARPRSVIGMIVGQTVTWTLVGCGIGAVAGLALTRLTETFLFDVKPNDPLAFALSVACLVLVALTAAFLPGRSAVHTNPMDTMRS